MTNKSFFTYKSIDQTHVVYLGVRYIQYKHIGNIFQPFKPIFDLDMDIWKTRFTHIRRKLAWS